MKPTATQTPKPTSPKHVRVKGASPSPLQPEFKPTTSIHVSFKNAPASYQVVNVEPLPTTVTSSVSDSVVSVKATATAASEGSSKSDDVVVLAMTGAVGGVVVMGAIWLVVKAASRTRKQNQSVSGASEAMTA